MRMKGSERFGLILLLIGAAIILGFLILPMISVFFYMPPQALWQQLLTPIALQALQLSVLTTCLSLILIIGLGTPLAYFLAHVSFPGKRIVEVLLQLPIVIPPAVAGVGLLLVFGRQGWLGEGLSMLGIQIAFTPAAVVMAQCFVSAPYYIQSARAAFAGIDANLLAASRTLGASRFKMYGRVVLPLALPGLISGAALSWGRALGEFGATLMFAGNLPGMTQTLPLAIYTAMQSDLGVAIAVSALLILVAFFILLFVKLTEKWPAWKRRRA